MVDVRPAAVLQREIDALAHRSQVLVNVYEDAENYDTGFPGGTWAGVNEWMEDIRSKVPPEILAQDKLTFDWSTKSSYYDSVYPSLSVYYWRDETDEEWEARKENVAKRQRALEQWKHRELARLKAELGK